MGESNNDHIYKWLALFVVIIGTFMAILDSTIVNIAIPKLMAVFGVSLDEIKWVLTIYTLTMAAVIPVTSYLSDVYGAKRIYIFALISFTIGSFLCGFAWSNSSMIIFRVIQAIGGGMIMPVGMSILLHVFEPKERGMAFGFYGIALMSAPAIGPTLGGYIIQSLDWRLIFYVNIPIGILGVIFALIILRSSERKKFENFDYLGFISSTIGLVSLLYVLGEGSTIDWGDFKNLFLIVLGCFSLIFFIFNELTHPNPLIDLRVFGYFNFSMSQIIVVILTIALMGGMYIVPIFLQNLRGYTAMETGLILLPSAIATGIAMPIAGKLFDKFGLKAVVIPGLILMTIPSWMLSSISLTTSTSSIVWLLTIRGIGLGLAMMPISTAGLNVVPKHLSGNASALSSTVRQIGSAFAVTIMTTLINSQLYNFYARIAEQITIFNPAAVDIINIAKGIMIKNGLSPQYAGSGAISQIYGFIYKQCYVLAMDYSLAVTAIITVAAIIGILFMKETHRHTETVNEGEEISATIYE